MRLSECRAEVLRKHPGCPDCGASFAKTEIEYYPHARGWRVDVFEERQWLFMTCGGCGYGWSLWKLGFGPEDFASKPGERRERV